MNWVFISQIIAAKTSNPTKRLPQHSFLNGHHSANLRIIVRFEVFTAVTMKNVALWDMVTPCGERTLESNISP
jgi:hypothetical protein